MSGRIIYKQIPYNSSDGISKSNFTMVVLTAISGKVYIEIKFDLILFREKFDQAVNVKKTYLINICINYDYERFRK